MIESLLRRYSDARDDLRLSDDELARFVRYAALIEKWNRVTNLVGSASRDTLVKTHLLDCLAVVPFIDEANVVDVGSGAGLPGIVIAIMRPDSRVTLIESRQRKARFLQQAAIELALDNVEVVAERVENWQPAGLMDCFVCRGYSALQKFFDETRAFHHPGCRLLALKGVTSAAEIAALSVDGCRVTVHPLDVPGWDHRHLVEISYKSPTAD